VIKQYNITDYIKDDPELQKAVIEEFLNDIKRLQAENERLKEEIKKEKEIYKENVHYLACMTSQRNKLKLALEEIRDIAGNIDDIDKWIEQNLMPSQVCERIEKINNKINEVLNGN